MSRSNRWVGGIVGTAVIALVFATAWAEGDGAVGGDGDAPVNTRKTDTRKTETQKTETRKTEPKRTETNRTETKPSAPPDGRPLAAARSKLSAAQAVLFRARGDYNQLGARLMSQFEKSPEMSNALAEERKAQEAYQAAVDAVLSKLASQPDYQAAVAEREKARRTVEQVRSSGAGPDELAKAATAAMNASAAASRMEGEAKEADADCVATLKALMEAHARVVSLREGYSRALKDDASWTEAAKRVEEAQARAAEAQKDLAERQKEYNAQRSAYQEYVRKKQDEERMRLARQRELNARARKTADGKTIISPPARTDGGDARK